MKNKKTIDAKLKLSTETLLALQLDSVVGGNQGAAGITTVGSVAISCNLPTRVSCFLCIPTKNGGQ